MNSNLSMQAPLTGYTGERLDALSGLYHLGNGYRAFSPPLMRFTCPDSLSPFSAGGINAYAYCAGDPINHADPSGHLSWQAITGIALAGIGLALTVFTAGASIAAEGGVMAALSSASAASLALGATGVVADVTAIASGALEQADPKASAILGWVSLAGGAVGAVGGVAHAGFAGMRVMERASSGSGSSRIVTLGWSSMHDLRILNRSGSNRELPLFLYIDFPANRAGSRLNLVGHAVYRSYERTAWALVDGLPAGLNGTGLVTMLERRGLDFTRFSDVRLLMCESARGGTNSLNSMAAQFAQASRLPTVGFMGAVTIEGSLVEHITTEVQAMNVYESFGQIGKIVNATLISRHTEWLLGERPPRFPYP